MDKALTLNYEQATMLISALRSFPIPPGGPLSDEERKRLTDERSRLLDSLESFTSGRTAESVLVFPRLPPETSDPKPYPTDDTPRREAVSFDFEKTLEALKSIRRQ